MGHEAEIRWSSLAIGRVKGDHKLHESSPIMDELFVTREGMIASNSPQWRSKTNMLLGSRLNRDLHIVGDLRPILSIFQVFPHVSTLQIYGPNRVPRTNV